MTSVLHCNSRNPPPSSSLSTEYVLAARLRKENPKNLQLGVIDPALIWQCFSMPCSLYDSMVYVTANGAHTDELSVVHNHTHTQTHTCSKEHTQTLAPHSHCLHRFLKSWRGRRKVGLEDQKGNRVFTSQAFSRAAFLHPPNVTSEEAVAQLRTNMNDANVSLSWKQGFFAST